MCVYIFAQRIASIYVYVCGIVHIHSPSDGSHRRGRLAPSARPPPGKDSAPPRPVVPFRPRESLRVSSGLKDCAAVTHFRRASDPFPFALTAMAAIGKAGRVRAGEGGEHAPQQATLE